MAAFPILSTGAVAQYPLARGTNFIVDIVRFLDGSEQRSLTRGRAQRRWVIQLSKVTEAELLRRSNSFLIRTKEISGALIYRSIQRRNRAQLPDIRSENYHGIPGGQERFDDRLHCRKPDCR